MNEPKAVTVDRYPPPLDNEEALQLPTLVRFEPDGTATLVYNDCVLLDGADEEIRVGPSKMRYLNYEQAYEVREILSNHTLGADNTNDE